MDSTTCYDLGKVREAYAGRFENQTEINLPLLRKVLQIHREGKVA
jgi:lipoate-protein ligase A